MSDPRPIVAFDISADRATVLSDTHDTVPGDGAVFRWLHFDLGTPGLADWAQAHLPPVACRALLAQRTRPRIDLQDEGLILTLRGINHNPGEEVEDMVSLRLWVTPQLVVTVRRQRIFAIDEIRGQIIAGDVPDSPIRLVARITERLVDGIETLTLDLEDRAEHMEDAVYDDSIPLPANLGQTRRQVITLRRHIGPMADALHELARAESPLIKKPFRIRLRDTANRARRSVDEVHEVVDRLTALADHIEMQQDQRLAHNSYRLSVVAAIFLPLGFLTGLFGVNVAGMPGTASPVAFWVLCGAMVGLGAVLYLFLRRIRWF